MFARSFQGFESSVTP